MKHLWLFIGFFFALAGSPMFLQSQNQPSIHTYTASADSGSIIKADSGTCGTIVYGEKVYHTVIIGSQCWMKENLNIGKWLDQSQVQKQANNEIVEKYCYGNDFVMCDQWGGLYQWDEMMMYSNASGAQGICPAGWHIPSANDWNNLILYLGGNSEAGGKLKTTGSRFWKSPNVGATNSSGFTALPGGSFDFLSQQWRVQNFGAAFWSSNTMTKETNVAMFLTYKNGTAEMDEEYRSSALSVRCIQDK